MSCSVNYQFLDRLRLPKQRNLNNATYPYAINFAKVTKKHVISWSVNYYSDKQKHSTDVFFEIAILEIIRKFFEKTSVTGLILKSRKKC